MSKKNASRRDVCRPSTKSHHATQRVPARPGVQSPQRRPVPTSSSQDTSIVVALTRSYSPRLQTSTRRQRWGT